MEIAENTVLATALLWVVWQMLSFSYANHCKNTVNNFSFSMKFK